MSKNVLFQLGAVCGILSGLLLAIGWTINIGRDSLIGASMVLAGYVLAIFAFTGMYGFQYKQIGFLGLLAFFLIVMSCAVFTPWLFLDIGRISGIIQGVGWQEVQENGATHVVGVIGGVGFVLGYLLFGIKTIQAKLLNKWPAILLIVAAIMPLIYTWVPIGKLLPRLAGLALMGFGIDLWVKSKGRN
ncbi:hypothetical protein [uncultured Allomuricauda sp.]|uniref:hypothetical protein n=1 Tax=Flagellimonas sp. W118 TaxID=3410791 RepID=UPI0026154BFB|nr:hypothetical protein [uncultured Allomuricauda sp.]